MPYRSLLFCPGSRPERIHKAMAAGADAICIDLEDAVPAKDRPQARVNVGEFLKSRSGPGPAVGVRINCLRTPDGVRDLGAALDWVKPDFLMIAKADYPDELNLAYEATGGAIPLWPMVESGRSLGCVWQIAAAPGVAGIQFGAADYSVDVRCEMEREPLLTARAMLAAACGSAKIQLLDVPYVDLQDEADLGPSTEHIKAMGFTGRSCIHPNHIATVNAIFTPTDEEVEHAKAVLAAYEAVGGGATTLKGQLVERPQVLAAQRVLSRLA